MFVDVSGTVSSVAISGPSIITWTGSPVVSSGTLTGTLATQAAGSVLAAPSAAAGVPTFRSLAVSDIPSLSSLYQPLDADLTSLAAASATDSLYYRSAANTWSPVTIGQGLLFSGGILYAQSLTQAIWTYSSNTTMADPTSGRVRTNFTAAASVTQIAISRYTDSGTDF